MNKKILVLLLTVLIIGGCASPARIEKMTISVQDTAKYKMSADLSQSINVKSVSGGETTNPMWTSEIGSSEFKKALIKSLTLTKLLAKDNSGEYELSTKMIKVDQPLFGVNFTVTSYIQYQLIRKSDKEIIFEQQIVAPYTATMSDSVLGVERLKLANEGSARENISQLIDKLYQYKITANQVNIKAE